MKTRFSLCLQSVFLLLVLNPCTVSYAVRVERSVDTWRPEHYLLNIALDDQLSEISSATARIDIVILKPTLVIDLDFGELTVDSVTLDSKPIRFTHKDGRLQITIPETLRPGKHVQVQVQ